MLLFQQRNSSFGPGSDGKSRSPSGLRLALEQGRRSCCRVAKVYFRFLFLSVHRCSAAKQEERQTKSNCANSNALKYSRLWRLSKKMAEFKINSLLTIFDFCFIQYIVSLYKMSQYLTFIQTHFVCLSEHIFYAQE